MQVLLLAVVVHRHAIRRREVDIRSLKYDREVIKEQLDSGRSYRWGRKNVVGSGQSFSVVDMMHQLVPEAGIVNCD